MKKKKQSTKLSLRTERLRNLDRVRLEDVQGGQLFQEQFTATNTNVGTCSGMGE